MQDMIFNPIPTGEGSLPPSPLLARYRHISCQTALTPAYTQGSLGRLLIYQVWNTQNYLYFWRFGGKSDKIFKKNLEYPWLPLKSN